MNVAEITLQGNTSINIGDTMIYQGPRTGSYEEVIASMEKEHEPVKTAVQGDSIAIKVNKTLRTNDDVFVIKKT